MDYVDFQTSGLDDALFPSYERVGKDQRRIKPPAGYYRVSAAEAGDPRCAAYEAAVANRMARESTSYGLRPTQCFAIEKLPRRPVGYVLEYRSRSENAPNGTKLSVSEFVLFDEKQRRVAGTLRNYMFTARTSRWFDMSGGNGVVDDDCNTVLGVQQASNITELIVKTLRNHLVHSVG